MIDWLEEILKEGEPAVVIPGGIVRPSAQPGGEVSGEMPANFPTPAEETIPLAALYRRMGETVGALTLTPPARREVRVEEGEIPRSGLTVRALDLAVRRDSRRYDGGMSVY